MNRATFDQFVTDSARLVEQITDLERIETESMEGIAKMEAEIKAVEEELTKETLIYNVNYAKNSKELTRRQNDPDVFQFILTFTRYEDATSLLQRKNAVSALSCFFPPPPPPLSSASYPASLFALSPASRFSLPSLALPLLLTLHTLPLPSPLKNNKLQ